MVASPEKSCSSSDDQSVSRMSGNSSSSRITVSHLRASLSRSSSSELSAKPPRQSLRPRCSRETAGRPAVGRSARASGTTCGLHWEVSVYETPKCCARSSRGVSCTMEPSRHSPPASGPDSTSAPPSDSLAAAHGCSAPLGVLQSRRCGGRRKGMATVARTADATVTSGEERRERTSGGSCLRRAVTVMQSSLPVRENTSAKVMCGCLAWLHSVRIFGAQRAASYICPVSSARRSTTRRSSSKLVSCAARASGRSSESSSRSVWQQRAAATTAPAEVPQMRDGRRPSSSSARATPQLKFARPPPPESARQVRPKTRRLRQSRARALSRAGASPSSLSRVCRAPSAATTSST
mmetsp:Transcript_24219/g.71809  ORF Transcript_24219/g.71809 Transcript_24219/m.71809 type:complete len:351 (-) Transcript_24219:288-1340(-)